MPRRPRLILPGIPLHIIQRGNNRQACFYADEDCRNYLVWLQEYANRNRCAPHAYVLMTNHVHLLVTPQTAEGAGQLMKQLGQRYVQYVNRTYRRTGTLWEGRFRSCLTQEEHYVLACYRYIELNPIRAGMVEHPAEYLWSSYRANTQGEFRHTNQPAATAESRPVWSNSPNWGDARLFNTRNDPHRTTTGRASFNIDTEYPFQPLRPSH